jgi:hypothetical protein
LWRLVLLVLLSRIGAAPAAVPGKMGGVAVAVALPTLLLRGLVLSERKRPLPKGAGAAPPKAPAFAPAAADATAELELFAAVLLIPLLL